MMKFLPSIWEPARPFPIPSIPRHLLTCFFPGQMGEFSSSENNGHLGLNFPLLKIVDMTKLKLEIVFPRSSASSSTS